MFKIVIDAIFETIVIILLIIGYVHEDQVVAFEQRIWKAICKKINRAIRNYERRKTHG